MRISYILCASLENKCETELIKEYLQGTYYRKWNTLRLYKSEQKHKSKLYLKLAQSLIFISEYY